MESSGECWWCVLKKVGLWVHWVWLYASDWQLGDSMWYLCVSLGGDGMEEMGIFESPWCSPASIGMWELQPTSSWAVGSGGGSSTVWCSHRIAAPCSHINLKRCVFPHWVYTQLEARDHWVLFRKIHWCTAFLVEWPFFCVALFGLVRVWWWWGEMVFLLF